MRTLTRDKAPVNVVDDLIDIIHYDQIQTCHVTKPSYLIARAHREVLHWRDQTLGDQLTVGGRSFSPQ